MRCGAWVLWKTVGKKRPKRKITAIISMYSHYVRGFPLTEEVHPSLKRPPRYKEEDLVQCDGQVNVSVRVSIDGGCACCGSVDLEVEYKCNKCGNTDFPELPHDEESLSDFLTGFFVGMEEAHRFTWLMTAKAEKEKYDAEMKKQLEKMKKEMEQRRKEQAEKRKVKKKKKSNKSK